MRKYHYWIVVLFFVTIMSIFSEERYVQAAKVVKIQVDTTYENDKENYYVYGLDANNNKVWTRDAGAYLSTEASPVTEYVKGKYVYLFENGQLLKLKKQNGQVVCKANKKFSVYGNCLFVDKQNHVYVQERSEKYLYKFSSSFKLMWKSNMERTRNSWAGEICATNQGIKVTYYGHTGEDDVWEHYVLFDKKTGRILAYQSWSDTPVWEWPVVRKKGSKRKNAIAAYKSILSKETIKLNKYTNAKAEYIQFKLCDIDGNKVPELLLTYGGASTSDGFYHILGIVDGKVKSIKRSYMSGFNIYKNSYIEESGAGRSPEGTATWIYLYKFDGKKARVIAKEYIDELETGGVRKTYTIYGKNVSYKKYKTQLDKIKKGKEVSGNWNTYLKNTKRNRKQALK